MDWPDDLAEQAFLGVDKLKGASDRGAMAADIVERIGLLEALGEFDPVIVGTLPIAIDIPDSDIDVLCHVCDLTAFNNFAKDRFGGFEGFRSHARAATKHVPMALVVQFYCDGLPLEIFATDRPSRQQYGFIHMLVEARILALMGDIFADQIRKLKCDGLKTEPAFAQLLELGGDPYLALAELAHLSPMALRDTLEIEC